MIVRWKSQSMQEIVEKLGGIPLYRVHADPPPGMATEDDLLRHLDGDDKRLFELVDGVLVEKPMGLRESVMASYVLIKIANLSQALDAGLVCGADGPVRMRGGNIRMPDVSFFPWESFPNGEFPADKISPVAPALAVEVLSESNTNAEIDLKLIELFRSGTELAWIIDPETESAKVYTSAKKPRTIDARGILDGSRVLSGLKIPLADVFSSIKRQKTRRKS